MNAAILTQFAAEGKPCPVGDATTRLIGVIRSWSRTKNNPRADREPASAKPPSAEAWLSGITGREDPDILKTKRVLPRYRPVVAGTKN